MTTNKPEVKIYEPSEKGATIMRKASFRNTGPDRYVRLSDYERLQAECESLRKASSELANWCLHEVGVDIELTPGLKQVMDITGDVYDEE